MTDKFKIIRAKPRDLQINSKDYDEIFRSHYGPGVDSVSNRNEYQEHFLVVKAAGT